VIKIGLFFGSSTGATRQVASQISESIQRRRPWTVELLDVAEFYLEEMAEFSYIILGIPTWDHGQLQRDWEEIFEEFEEIALDGKLIAVFGLGDQVGYPDTFGDALFFLADKARGRGATLVAPWPATGYTFKSSWAIENDEFLGLIIDEENQPDLTDARIESWVDRVIAAFEDKLNGNDNTN
jgi:flavodoxin long chain